MTSKMINVPIPHDVEPPPADYVYIGRQRLATRNLIVGDVIIFSDASNEWPASDKAGRRWYGDGTDIKAVRIDSPVYRANFPKLTDMQTQPVEVYL